MGTKQSIVIKHHMICNRQLTDLIPPSVVANCLESVSLVSSTGRFEDVCVLDCAGKHLSLLAVLRDD